MKKNFTIVAVAVAILGLGLSSCKKENLTPDGVNPAAMSDETNASDEANRSYTYYSGIISNNGYPTAGSTEMGYFSTNAYWGQMAPTTQPFGGSTTSTVKGLAATKQSIVFAYVGADGVTYLNFGHNTIANANYADAGQDIPVLLNGTTLFTYPIEEIEIDPITLDVYALTRVGNSIKLYRIEGISSAAPGTATVVTYNGSTTIFNNPLSNGYKWGSICFVPNGNGTFRFVFASESTVYASLGIVTWHYTLSGNTLTVLTPMHRTYSTGTSGIAAGTGINA
ncbi:MAG TPA: hypothetical protein VGC65_09400, partial [Bacteroidia bacterium]